MALSRDSREASSADPAQMAAIAREASEFLKAVGQESRLMILCNLVSGEKSVGELEQLLDARQAAVSQQLARLRLQGFVTTRREGKIVYYRLADDRVTRIIETVHELFCEPGTP